MSFVDGLCLLACFTGFVRMVCAVRMVGTTTVRGCIDYYYYTIMVWLVGITALMALCRLASVTMQSCLVMS